ncbi:hypothetical protein [Bradyrhizobium centrosematis]|uniref:hypothetical protein n=1 Tax=Bradyrhizobium centrosematis TaxID=1300039 RepID=UPI003890FBC6
MSDDYEALPEPRQPDQQADQLSLKAGSSTGLSDHQAEFGEPLHALHTDHRVSAPAAGSPSLQSETPPMSLHYPAASFVGARAQLGATLTGAALEALKNEIAIAEQQSARWAPADAPEEDRDDRDRIFGNVATSSYLKLHRFQNQGGDCIARAETSTSAISHVRNRARDHSFIGDPLERSHRSGTPGWVAYARQNNGFPIRVFGRRPLQTDSFA